MWRLHSIYPQQGGDFLVTTQPGSCGLSHHHLLRCAVRYHHCTSGGYALLHDVTSPLCGGNVNQLRGESASRTHYWVKNEFKDSGNVKTPILVEMHFVLQASPGGGEGYTITRVLVGPLNNNLVFYASGNLLGRSLKVLGRHKRHTRNNSIDEFPTNINSKLRAHFGMRGRNISHCNRCLETG